MLHPQEVERRDRSASGTRTAVRARTFAPAARGVSVVRGLSGLDRLRPIWDAIPAPWASPMQSIDWVRTWAEVYGFADDLEILVAGQDPDVAIAPLFRSRRDGQRLEFVGPDELGEAMDFLGSDPACVAGLAAALARSRLPLRFWRVPADSPVVEALRDVYRWRGIIHIQPTAGCPSLPLDETWADPERHLDARRRSNIRRARRIAEAMGSVTCEVLSPHTAEVGRLLEEAYAVEASGWKGRRGSALAQEVLAGEFFRRYAAAASERGTLRLCLLRINGRAAAMKLGALAGNRFWLLKTGYSEAFERCSPGALLMLETIRYAAQSGLRSYEFLGADEPWVRHWTQYQRPCVSIRAYPFSARGAAALARDAGAGVRARGEAVRAAIRGIPRAVERRAAQAYVAGPDLEDGLRVCRSLGERGFRSTICYVNSESDPPRTVADRYEAAVDAIGAGRLDCYASVKAPLLGFSRDLLRGIAERARKRDVGLHFDALAVQDTDATFSLIRDLRASHPRIGCTLPSRWRRSLSDADRAVDLGLSVRIVKGEWADPVEPEVDPRAGYLGIVDRIAGRVRRVAVATHDPALARAAVRRLRSAGTPCELEVLLGYPIRRVIPIAEAEGVPMRVYVPYGLRAAPYSLSNATKNPRIAGWALRDLLRGRRSRVPKLRPRVPAAREPNREPFEGS